MSASTARPATCGKACACTRPGKQSQAEKLFARHDSLEARIGESFSRWPDGTVARLTQLSGLHPKSAAVQLNLGLAQFWAGQDGAKAAWQSAAELEPDTAYAVTAGNLLHPNFARNLPIFVPIGEVPAAIRRLPPPAQFAALERRARNGTVADRLFYGAALQRLGRAAARPSACTPRPRGAGPAIPKHVLLRRSGCSTRRSPPRRSRDSAR